MSHAENTLNEERKEMDMSENSAEPIKAFWQDRVSDPNVSKELVNHPDFNQRLLEIEVLKQYLPKNCRILDVGCGNGIATGRYAKYATEIVGIDYSEGMINRAKIEWRHLSNVKFEVQDILDLQFPDNSFDVVISQRCLINLTSWSYQQKAIANIARVLKADGFFFMQEGSRQGREALNQAREAVGIARMPKVAYNLDFDEEKLWPFLRQNFNIIEIRRFGIYDLISRVVHPLLVQPASPCYDSKINEIARHVSTALRGCDELSREFSAFLKRLG